MSLLTAIRRELPILAQVTAGDYVGAATAFDTNSITLTDSTLRTTRWLIETFNTVVDVGLDTTEADVIIDGLAASTLGRARNMLAMMNAEGVDMSTSEIQKLLNNVAVSAGWSTNLRNRLKRWGSWAQKPWEKHNLAGAPTALEIETVWVQYVALTTQQNLFATVINDYLNPVSTDKAALIIGLQDAIIFLQSN